MARNNFNTAAANDNAPDPDDMLLQAVFENNLENVRKWLKAGANKDARGDDGYSPLLLAAREGYEEIAEYLLAQEADVTLTNAFGRNALGEALRKHRSDKLVLALLEAGCPADVQDAQGNTAAFYAAQDDRAVVMSALVAAKADLTLANKKGVTPLIWATRLQHIDVIRAMMDENVALDHQDEDGMTALMHAVKSRNLMLTGAYIGMKANVMRMNKDNRRALDFAQESGDAGIISMIKKAEAEIYQPFRQGIGGVRPLRTAKFGKSAPAQ